MTALCSNCRKPIITVLCPYCAEKPMPIVDIPPKIPTIKGEPAIKFGLKFLTVWTEQKEGFKVTQDLQPGFALPVLVLEKIPTPEQIEQVGRALDGKVHLGSGDSVTFKFGTPVNGVTGFFGVQAPSPGAGLLQLGTAASPLTFWDDPLGIAGTHANVVRQRGEDYIELDHHNKVVEKAQALLRSAAAYDRSLVPITARAQEMSTKGKWGRLGENHLTNALDRIEQLEKERNEGYLLLPGTMIGTQGVELSMAPDGALYITKNEPATAARQALSEAKARIDEMVRASVQSALDLDRARTAVESAISRENACRKDVTTLRGNISDMNIALAVAQERVAALEKDLALACQEADHMRAQSIGFDADRQTAMGKADNFKALLVEVLDDNWLDAKQAAHARHEARIKAMLGRS